MSAPWKDTGTSHVSAGCSSRFDKPMLPPWVVQPSASFSSFVGELFVTIPLTFVFRKPLTFPPPIFTKFFPIISCNSSVDLFRGCPKDIRQYFMWFLGQPRYSHALNHREELVSQPMQRFGIRTGCQQVLWANCLQVRFILENISPASKFLLC